MMSGDGDWFPVATTACSQTVGSRCCDWLYFATRGGGACGSSNQRARAHRRPQQEGGVMYVRIVYSDQ